MDAGRARARLPGRRRAAVVGAVVLLAGVVVVVHGSDSASARGRLLWSDEFSGRQGYAPSSRSWTPELGGGGWGNEEVETYTSRAANLHLDGSGHLAITARRESYAGTDHVQRQWTSARITTLDKHAFQYGLIEVRAKLPTGAGMWPAMWMMGTDIREIGWPACGEIDINESADKAPQAVQSLHGPQSGAEWTLTKKTAAKALPAGYHDYGINWQPDKVQFLLDDKVTVTYTPKSLAPGQAWAFNAPQYLLLDLAVGGRFPGSPNASSPAQASLLIDSVRVYDNGFAKKPT